MELFAQIVLRNDLVCSRRAVVSSINDTTCCFGPESRWKAFLSENGSNSIEDGELSPLNSALWGVHNRRDLNMRDSEVIGEVFESFIAEFATKIGSKSKNFKSMLFLDFCDIMDDCFECIVLASEESDM